MAVMTTVLNDWTEQGNTKVFVTSASTAELPQKVVQSRREPVGNQTMMEDKVSVVFACKDAAGNILPQPVTYIIHVKRPKDAVASYVNGAVAVAKDLVACDEMANTIATQGRLK